MEETSESEVKVFEVQVGGLEGGRRGVSKNFFLANGCSHYTNSLQGLKPRDSSYDDEKMSEPCLR